MEVMGEISKKRKRKRRRKREREGRRRKGEKHHRSILGSTEKCVKSLKFIVWLTSEKFETSIYTLGRTSLFLYAWRRYFPVFSGWPPYYLPSILSYRKFSLMLHADPCLSWSSSGICVVLHLSVYVSVSLRICELFEGGDIPPPEQFLKSHHWSEWQLLRPSIYMKMSNVIILAFSRWVMGAWNILLPLRRSTKPSAWGALHTKAAFSGLRPMVSQSFSSD